MADFVLFIDTNVLLDFYRARNDVGLDLLALIDQHKDKVITTYQVEMEFKKNRQQVIIEALGGLKKPEIQWTIPAFLKEAKAVSAMKKSVSQVHKQITSLQKRTRRVLANPTTYDPVYQPIQRLFRQDSPLNLSREKKIRFTIRRLARKRFTLGYPPRKDRDTSIGDAVNWEWIIHCTKTAHKDVIIVSRDSDYGVVIDGNAYINDWLFQEFRARVSRKRQAILTSRLTEALKKANIRVTKEQEKEESAIIEQRRAFEEQWKAVFVKLEEALRRVSAESTDPNMSLGQLLLNMKKHSAEVKGRGETQEHGSGPEQP